MPKGYHHLTYDQGCQISALMESGLNQNKIAKSVGVSQSTISKELSRNSGQRGYRYKSGDANAVARRHQISVAAYKMTPELIEVI